MRSSIGSYFLGYSNIGVLGAVQEQGPGIGYYNNITGLYAGYLLGRDVTSDSGAGMSPFYWSSGPTYHDISFSNDEHRQTGSSDGRGGIGNEWNPANNAYFNTITKP